MRRTMAFVLVACTMALIGGPAWAGVSHPVTARIDFNRDRPGVKPNGWSSREARNVSFSDSLGADLDVESFGFQGRGQALAVNDDDPSYLIIDLDGTGTCIRMWFGNDDPCCSNQGDEAVLTVFSGGNQVGQNSVELNRNDFMDQQISVCGVAFDQATFLYDVTTPGLIEIVDEISIQSG